MKIKQVFKSSSDGRVISEIEIGGADTLTPMPIAGDNVRWIVNNEVYSGRVKSRLISYSAADKVALDRLDAVDVTAELSVELAAS